MATYGWTAQHSVEEWIYQHPEAFDFYQAVRLLEWMHVDKRVPLGETAVPDRESVRFRSEVFMDFQPNEISDVALGPALFVVSDGVADALEKEEVPAALGTRFLQNGIHFDIDAATVKTAAKGRAWRLVDTHNNNSFIAYRTGGGDVIMYAGQAQMGVNFIGLAGIEGPLPVPYTAILQERIREDETIMRDFLDIFNHRIVSIMYRIRETRRVGFRYTRPGTQHDPFANYIYSLIGLGTPYLHNRMAIPDRALLQYAGILANETRSANGLEILLTDYFGIPIRVEQFAGRWLCLEEMDRARLGGPNSQLGTTMVLGRRVYDVQSQIGLEIGPVGYRTYQDFLPGGANYAVLHDLVRFYTRDEFEVVLTLRLKRPHMRPWRLGQQRLGWTTWLRDGDSADRPDVTVKLSTKRT